MEASTCFFLELNWLDNMKVATERTGAMYSFHVYQNAP